MFRILSVAMVCLISMPALASKYSNFLEYAKNGFTEDLIELIDSKQVLSYNYQDTEGNSALHYAVANCNHSIIEILFSKDPLNSSLDINLKNKKGETPLYLAAMNCLGAIDLLLAQKKVDLESGPTEFKDDVDLVITPLSALIYHADFNLSVLDKYITNLILAGADLNAKIYHAETKMTLSAFHYLSAGDFPASFKEAVKKVSNLNVRDDENKTALIIAAENSSLENIKTLIKAKVLLNLRDQDGNTALHFGYQNYLEALKEGDGKKLAFSQAILTALVEAGADRSLKNLKNESAYPSSIKGWRCKLNCDFKLE